MAVLAKIKADVGTAVQGPRRKETAVDLLQWDLLRKIRLLGKGAFPYETYAVNRMSCEDYLGFLDSWSAVNTAREKGEEILDEKVKDEFRRAWGDPQEVKDAKNELYLLLGRANAKVE